MKNRRLLVLLLLAVVFIGLPVLADRRLAARYARHDELVRMAECYPLPCAADFNGNGTLDTLVVVQKNPDDRLDWRLIVVDGERELFSVPYNLIDNSFRTHAAIYRPSSAGAPHLLIYDGTSGRRVDAVFAWDGRGMREVEASSLEREILSAMAARDDTGGWHRWAVWKMASPLLWFIYCPLVGGALVLFGAFWLRRGRTRLP